MSAKKKSAVAKRMVKKSPKQKKMNEVELDKFKKSTKINWKNVTKQFDLPTQKKSRKKTLQDKIRETFKIRDVLPGVNLVEPKVPDKTEELVEMLGDQEPSSSHSGKNKNLTINQFKDVLNEMFPTLNQNIKAAEETMKLKIEDRRARAKLFETEYSILNSVIGSLQRLIQFDLRAGRYDRIVEYSQLIVSFSEKAKLVQPTIGSTKPATIKAAKSQRDQVLDDILVKGKISDLLCKTAKSQRDQVLDDLLCSVPHGTPTIPDKSISMGRPPSTEE